MSFEPQQPDRSVDPSGSTQAFRAFTESPEPAPPAASKTPLIVGGVVAAALVILVVLWVALG